MKSSSSHDPSVYSRRDLTHVTSFSAEWHCCLPTPPDVSWDYSLPSPLTPCGYPENSGWMREHMKAVFSNGNVWVGRKLSEYPFPTIRCIWIWNMFSRPGPSLLNIKDSPMWESCLECSTQQNHFHSAVFLLPLSLETTRIDMIYITAKNWYLTFFICSISPSYIPLFKTETRPLLPLGCYMSSSGFQVQSRSCTF